jgi:uncharacterized protein (DUF952 family)
VARAPGGRGVIHVSLAGQLAEVAELGYDGCEDELVVLVMDMRRLEAAGLPLRFEDGGIGTYHPHICAGASRPRLVVMMFNVQPVSTMPTTEGTPA